MTFLLWALVRASKERDEKQWFAFPKSYISKIMIPWFQDIYQEIRGPQEVHFITLALSPNERGCSRPLRGSDLGLPRNEKDLV